MKAVILAGGYGTRMRPLTFSRPKPLLPLVNKPVTTHILDHLAEQGITEVAITTNYLREQIEHYFGSRHKGMTLTYPVEEQPMGTAGCVRNIKDYFDDTFIVMQGDTICDINLTELIQQHKYYSGLATIAAIKVNDPWNYGIMEVEDNGRVRQFHEKPLMDQYNSNLINTGIYVLEPETLDHIPPKTFYDFAKDLFPILVDSQGLFAHPVNAFWVDVGRPSGYTAAKKWLMAKESARIADSAVIEGEIEGDVVLGENARIGTHSKLFGPIIVGDNVTLDSGCVIGPYTVLGSGVTIRENSVINGAVFFENIQTGSGEDVSNSFIAENCRIGSGGRIQSDVMIGGGCYLQENVSVISGSRIWPNMQINDNSMVSGTLKRFIQVHEIRDDPKWTLRTVTPDEGFYFNKFEGKHVSYTGLRALNLLDFSNILKQVELSSIEYHLRSDVNDFEQWMTNVVCDRHLAELFNELKSELSRTDRKVMRHHLIDVTNERINTLLNVVKPKGYL